MKQMGKGWRKLFGRFLKWDSSRILLNFVDSCLNSVNEMSFLLAMTLVRSTTWILSGLHQERISLCAAWMILDEEMAADPNLPNTHRVPSCLVLPPRFGFTVLTSFSEAAKDGKMVMPQPNDKVRGGLASGCLGICWDALGCFGMPWDA